MADNTQVLREYLLSLGFRVNATEHKKFDDAVDNTGKIAARVGLALVGAAAAAAYMVKSYGEQMEKLYYSSKRGDSTVAKMQDMRFAAKQIGIEADAMTSTIENMAMVIRQNPGMGDYLERLGVPVKGRDIADVAVDLVEALSRMPFEQANLIASMFEIDPKMFLQWARNQDLFRDSLAKSAKATKDSGVDADAAADAFVEWERAMAEVEMRTNRLRGALAIGLLPVMQWVTKAAGALIDGLTAAVKDPASYFEKVGKAMAAFDNPSYGAEDQPATPSGPASKGPGFMGTVRGWADKLRNYGHVRSGAADNRQGMSPEQIAQMFAGLEQQYGLPDGVLDALWSQESGRGANMKSPTGVLGHFQITGRNRKALGIADPDNLSEEAVGASEMLSQLLKQYKGDLSAALTHWNAGGAGSAKLGTDEARNFAPGVMRKMEQNNTFIIHGGNGREIAAAVGQQLDKANGNLLRDQKGTIQ